MKNSVYANNLYRYRTAELQSFTFLLSFTGIAERLKHFIKRRMSNAYKTVLYESLTTLSTIKACIIFVIHLNRACLRLSL